MSFSSYEMISLCRNGKLFIHLYINEQLCFGKNTHTHKQSFCFLREEKRILFSRCCSDARALKKNFSFDSASLLGGRRGGERGRGMRVGVKDREGLVGRGMDDGREKGIRAQFLT